MYRLTFYKIPAMRGGYKVPFAPVTEDITSTWSEYRIYECVTDLAFSEDQGRIVVDDGQTIADGQANYVRVAMTNSQTLYNYSTDKNASFWWVDGIDLLGVYEWQTAVPAVVYITSDPWMSNMYAYYPSGRPSGIQNAAPKISGRLAQTSVAALYKDVVTFPPMECDYTGATVKTHIACTTSTRYIAILSAQDGSIYAVGNAGTTTTEPLTTLKQAAAIRIPSSSAGQIEKNVSVLRIYALSNDFLANANWQYQRQIQIKITNTEDWKTGFSIFDTTIGAGKSATVSKTCNVPEFGYGDGYETGWQFARVFLKTPKQLIDATNIYRGGTSGASGAGQEGYPSYDIFLSYHSGSTDISILLCINGEFTDISDDFTVDFAVNDAAVKQTQNKQLFALNAITSVIGAVGGAIGGVKSGNLFGAVQSIAGGVQNLAGMAADRRAPASVRGEGDAETERWARGAVCSWVIVYPKNWQDYESICEKFGFLRSTPKIYAGESLDNIAVNAYYRFDDVQIEGIEQNAAAEIAADLIRGVWIGLDDE